MAEDDPSTALIRAKAAIDPGYVQRLFHIESGGNPNAVTGSNRGLGQFGPQEERRYGITAANRTDPAAQAAAVHREAIEHANVLRNALGRDPTPGELYFTHQQGIAGGPRLLTADPSVPAWQAIRQYYPSDRVAQLAITGNIPSNDPLKRLGADQITAGDFRNMWVNKFERGLAGAGATAAPGAPTAAMPQPMGGVPPPGTSATGGAVAMAPAPVGPSQTGAVPVAPQNQAPANDALLKTLQALSSPQQPQVPAPMQLNAPRPPGLDLATAIARAQGRERIA